MAVIKTEKIRAVSCEILIKKGVPKQQADIIADTIVDAHMKEKHTHGMGRLSIYVRKIDSGQMSADTRLDRIKDTPVITILDAHNGFGQVAGYYGAKLCIDKAHQYGVGIVGIKDSNSFGMAGYYGTLMAQNNMIGLVLGNASPALAPENGKKAIMGTNPICVSFPGTKTYPHIVLDMACSVAARGKVRLAAKTGEKIPETWAKDENGFPTDDPQEALKGSMNAIGGYKGFGLAVAVDILSGMLTDSAFAGEVKALNTPNGYSRYGHFLCALNPGFFMEHAQYESQLDHLITNIKECGDPGNVFMPGERAYLNSLKNRESVQVSDTIVNGVNDLARSLNVDELC